MKRFALVAVLLFSGAAFAQPQPVEVQPSSELVLSRGEVKVFRFDTPLKTITAIVKGVIEASPLSDREVSIAGVTPGSTRLIISDDAGRPLYSANVIVSPDPGRIVKIYGLHDKNEDLNAGYSSVYCNELGCGRPDHDLPKPTSIAVERVRTDRARR